MNGLTWCASRPNQDPSGLVGPDGYAQALAFSRSEGVAERDRRPDERDQADPRFRGHEDVRG